LDKSKDVDIITSASSQILDKDKSDILEPVIKNDNKNNVDEEEIPLFGEGDTDSEDENQTQKDPPSQQENINENNQSKPPNQIEMQDNNNQLDNSANEKEIEGKTNENSDGLLPEWVRKISEKQKELLENRTDFEAAQKRRRLMANKSPQQMNRMQNQLSEMISQYRQQPAQEPVNNNNDELYNELQDKKTQIRIQNGKIVELENSVHYLQEKISDLSLQLDDARKFANNKTAYEKTAAEMARDGELDETLVSTWQEIKKIDEFHGSLKAVRELWEKIPDPNSGTGSDVSLSFNDSNLLSYVMDLISITELINQLQKKLSQRFDQGLQRQINSKLKIQQQMIHSIRNEIKQKRVNDEKIALKTQLINLTQKIERLTRQLNRTSPQEYPEKWTIIEDNQRSQLKMLQNSAEELEGVVHVKMQKQEDPRLTQEHVEIFKNVLKEAKKVELKHHNIEKIVRNYFDKRLANIRMKLAVKHVSNVVDKLRAAVSESKNKKKHSVSLMSLDALHQPITKDQFIQARPYEESISIQTEIKEFKDIPIQTDHGVFKSPEEWDEEIETITKNMRIIAETTSIEIQTDKLEMTKSDIEAIEQEDRERKFNNLCKSLEAKKAEYEESIRTNQSMQVDIKKMKMKWSSKMDEIEEERTKLRRKFQLVKMTPDELIEKQETLTKKTHELLELREKYEQEHSSLQLLVREIDEKSACFDEKYEAARKEILELKKQLSTSENDVNMESMQIQEKQHQIESQLLDVSQENDLNKRQSSIIEKEIELEYDQYNVKHTLEALNKKTVSAFVSNVLNTCVFQTMTKEHQYKMDQLKSLQQKNKKLEKQYKEKVEKRYRHVSIQTRNTQRIYESDKKDQNIKSREENERFGEQEELDNISTPRNETDSLPIETPRTIALSHISEPTPMNTPRSKLLSPSPRGINQSYEEDFHSSAVSPIKRSLLNEYDKYDTESAGFEPDIVISPIMEEIIQDHQSKTHENSFIGRGLNQLSQEHLQKKRALELKREYLTKKYEEVSSSMKGTKKIVRNQQQALFDMLTRNPAGRFKKRYRNAAHTWGANVNNHIKQKKAASPINAYDKPEVVQPPKLKSNSFYESLKEMLTPEDMSDFSPPQQKKVQIDHTHTTFYTPSHSPRTNNSLQVREEHVNNDYSDKELLNASTSAEFQYNQFIQRLNVINQSFNELI